MAITLQELKILATILRFADEHIVDAQRMIPAEPAVRDAAETDLLRKLKDIGTRIGEARGQLSALIGAATDPNGAR